MGLRFSRHISCFSESVSDSTFSVESQRVLKTPGFAEKSPDRKEKSGFSKKRSMKKVLPDIFECDESQISETGNVIHDEKEEFDSGIGDNISQLSHLSSSDENRELDILLQQIPRNSSEFDEKYLSEIDLQENTTNQSHISSGYDAEDNSENVFAVEKDESSGDNTMYLSPSISTQQLFIPAGMVNKIERTKVLLSNLKMKYKNAHLNIYKRGNAYGELVILGYEVSMPVNKIKSQIGERIPGIKGIDVIIKHPYHVSDKALKVNEMHRKINQLKIPDKDLQLIRECIQQNSSMLWKNHSNLMIITGDCLKSLKGRIIFRPCIVFYCLSKGFVPLYEDEFPKKLSCRLGNIETDVREGFFLPGPSYGVMDVYNDPICMGSSIGSQMRNTSGTLGLFVDLPNNQKGFLTCCHVLFNCIQPMSFDYELSTDSARNLVIQPGNASLSGGPDDICGYIQKAIFSPNMEPISLDAALVEVTEREPDTGHFVIKDKTQVWDIGYSMDSLPLYKTGAIRRTVIPEDYEKPLIKSGTSTGITRSSFRLNGAEVRIFDHDIMLGTQENAPIVMKGQYEIESCHDLKTFFDSGDSGSAVFMKDSDGSLSCIGMAIGKTSYHSTVVTPIGAILDAFDLSDANITKFM